MKYFATLIVGLLLGLTLSALIRGCSNDINRKTEPPKLGGQNVPESHFVLDFNKRYNVICSRQENQQKYENVKILGFTGQEVKESTGSFSKGYNFFDKWLVVEQQDGRKVYFSINSISFLEEYTSVAK